jgi:hypothetical protein
MSRSQRTVQRLSATAIALAVEPPYVCGAGTHDRYPSCEIKSGHETVCQRRSHKKSGKKEKNPLLGVVCLLTTGVLISVGRDPDATTAESNATGRLSQRRGMRGPRP